jgi:hypothetical protein
VKPTSLSFLLLLVMAGGAAVAGAQQPDCGPREEPAEVDRVMTIEDSERGLVAVHFREHAAIYFLRRSGACYESLRALLDRSLQESLAVRFWYRLEGQEIVAATAYRQLLVTSAMSDEGCLPAPLGWRDDAASERATPEEVSDDLGRYLGALSFQATSLLDAVWHGKVRFCQDHDQTDVLSVLAKLVVRPPDPRFPAGAPGSAQLGEAERSLLLAFAGPPLEEALRAAAPADEIERQRRTAALALVAGPVARAGDP